jgi:hypothetical protein
VLWRFNVTYAATPQLVLPNAAKAVLVNPNGCAVQIARSLDVGVAVLLEVLPHDTVASAKVANCAPAEGEGLWLVGKALHESSNIWGNRKASRRLALQTRGQSVPVILICHCRSDSTITKHDKARKYQSPWEKFSYGLVCLRNRDLKRAVEMIFAGIGHIQKITIVMKAALKPTQLEGQIVGKPTGC